MSKSKKWFKYSLENYQAKVDAFTEASQGLDFEEREAELEKLLESIPREQTEHQVAGKYADMENVIVALAVGHLNRVLFEEFNQCPLNEDELRELIAETDHYLFRVEVYRKTSPEL